MPGLPENKSETRLAIKNGIVTFPLLHFQLNGENTMIQGKFLSCE